MTEAGAMAPALKLAAWYEANQRDLPWRRTRDPYAIWLSETMLQQTRVETVIPYYHEFLGVYPTVGDLAAAPEAEVLKRWQGLGYYSRARNLHKAAQAVVREHQGTIPAERDAFASLPGVGPYTTGAVMSIAFDQPVPAVDGNVLRVMSRFLGIQKPISDPACKRQISDQTADWLQQTAPRMLTQALMELGALVCVPRDPRCTDCPLQGACVAYRDGLTKVLPMRPAKAERRKQTVAALWCERDGRVLMEQRPAEGLLAGMWQPPAVACESPAADAKDSGVTGPDAAELHADRLSPDGLHAAANGLLRRLYGSSAPDLAAGERGFIEIARLKHIFTHIEWDVRVLRPVGWVPPEPAPAGTVWADESALSTMALPRVYDRLLTKFFGQQLLVGD